MGVRYRIPGLQVPVGAEGETLAFFNALKERLELLGGERGDPEQRSVSLRELKDAGVIGIQRTGRSARPMAPTTPTDDETDKEDSTAHLDFSSYPDLRLAEAPDEMQLLVQGTSVNDRYRLLLSDLLTLFARLDQESTVEFPWSFEAEEYGFALTGHAPAFRFVELAEESDSEPALPADASVWEIEVDRGELSIYLVNDNDDTRVRVARLVRSGMVGTLLDIETAALRHNGSQVVTRADVNQAEVDLGSPPRLSGRFTVTDARISASSTMLVTLAPGPYAGKGTRADEAEMYAGMGFAAAPGTGNATVYWSSPHRVRGHIKVNYLIG